MPEYGMTARVDEFSLASKALEIKVTEAYWDSSTFGYPVAQVETLTVFDRSEAKNDFLKFFDWVRSNEIKLISCRLPSDRMTEVFFLEEHGFRFIETVLHPFCENLEPFALLEEKELVICRPDESDLPAIGAIAESAFTNERFYVDPRLSKAKSGLRYRRWAENSYAHPSQILLKIQRRKDIVAFFVVERVTVDEVYWHLTAINPAFQGQGYGRRVWAAMLSRHYGREVKVVSTTIAARNLRVLNLYASLNFRFRPPEHTFHWVCAL
jgi:RimJ/RimL family protein N-acetyltransferase